MKYYTTAQVMKLLNVCQQRVHQIARRRKWTVIKDGRRNLYRREDVQAEFVRRDERQRE